MHGNICTEDIVFSVDNWVVRDHVSVNKRSSKYRTAADDYQSTSDVETNPSLLEKSFSSDSRLIFRLANHRVSVTPNLNESQSLF